MSRGGGVDVSVSAAKYVEHFPLRECAACLNTEDTQHLDRHTRLETKGCFVLDLNAALAEETGEASESPPRFSQSRPQPQHERNNRTSSVCLTLFDVAKETRVDATLR